MKIAIVGSGISGLTSAYFLRDHADITVFEAGSYVGGHTNTLKIIHEDETHNIDTGFIVFNNENYPNFTRLMSTIGVKSQDTSMSFSVRDDQIGLEYCGTNLNTLFSQRKNIFNFSFYKMIFEINHFRKDSPKILKSEFPNLSLGQYLKDKGYSKLFQDQFIYPMGAAIWSCPKEKMFKFPAKFFVAFFHNHGFLKAVGQPKWRVIKGGSKSYVEPLTKSFSDRIILDCPVKLIERCADGVMLQLANGRQEEFDKVILSCHSNQALKILGNGANDTESKVLSSFPYQKNKAVLHTDIGILPRKRNAWASWNYFVGSGLDGESQLSVSYHMNRLQSIQSEHDFIVSLNCDHLIDPNKVIRSIDYEHPVYTVEGVGYQNNQLDLCPDNKVYYCGAYWGYGFHEDGMKSGLNVVESILGKKPW